MAMKESNTECVINGFTRFNDLARDYFPEATTTNSASRKFKAELLKHPSLLESLTEKDFDMSKEYLTPSQQETIVEYLGPPSIRIKIKTKEEI